MDASKKRKSTQEDDESTLIGGDSELIRGLLEKINPSLLDLNVDADSLKKTNHSSLGGYINDGEGSLFLVYDTLRSHPVDTDKELAISVINSLVAQRKAKLPPAESIQLPESTGLFILDILLRSLTPRQLILNSKSSNSGRFDTHSSKVGPEWTISPRLVM